MLGSSQTICMADLLAIFAQFHRPCFVPPYRMNDSFHALALFRSSICNAQHETAERLNYIADFSDLSEYKSHKDFGSWGSTMFNSQRFLIKQNACD